MEVHENRSTKTAFNSPKTASFPGICDMHASGIIPDFFKLADYLSFSSRTTGRNSRLAGTLAAERRPRLGNRVSDTSANGRASLSRCYVDSSRDLALVTRRNVTQWQRVARQEGPDRRDFGANNCQLKSVLVMSTQTLLRARLLIRNEAPCQVIIERCRPSAQLKQASRRNAKTKKFRRNA